MLYGCGLVGIIGCGKCVIDQHLKKKKRVLKEKKWKIRFFIKKKFVYRRALQEADGEGGGPTKQL